MRCIKGTLSAKEDVKRQARKHKLRKPKKIETKINLENKNYYQNKRV